MPAPNFRSRNGFVQMMGGDPSEGTSTKPGPDEWRLQASCADRDLVPDPDIFYDETEEAAARAVCETCPVRGQCLDEFTFDRFAFAGGMTPAERRVWVIDGSIPVRDPDPEIRHEPTQEERVLALVELRASYDYISRRLGVDVAAVKELHRRKGVEYPEDVPKKFRGRAMSDLARLCLIGLYSGDPQRVIADKVQCYPASVANIKRRLMYPAA